jgi:hypothetical protein
LRSLQQSSSSSRARRRERKRKRSRSRDRREPGVERRLWPVMSVRDEDAAGIRACGRGRT